MNLNKEPIKDLALIDSQDGLEKWKRENVGLFNSKYPANSQIIEFYKKAVKEGSAGENKILERLLTKKKIRSLSGVAVVSVLTKPFPCPGRCLYCPTEKEMPKSYLKGEPAADRALSLHFDPFLQVAKRIEVLEKTGHNVDKVELIVIGGTWSCLPEKYQAWFIKECFRGANAPKGKSLPYSEKQSLKNIYAQLLSEQRKNEKVKHRVVGMTLETRPDYITDKEVKRMRILGATKVELGVQSVFDDILKINLRDHGAADTQRATFLLRQNGFKVCYHLMPGLYGSSLKKDREVFETVFADEKFKPDWLKIYPCVVLPEAQLYSLYKKGDYVPYSDEELVSLLVDVKQNIIPRWTRIARLYRDIPTTRISAGTRISNLRELVQKRLEGQGGACQCIHCREVRDNYQPGFDLKMFMEEYKTQGGKEIFLSFETADRKYLLSFLRLRIPETSKGQSFSTLSHTGLIRELHTYGLSLGLKKQEEVAAQHKGLGKKLIKQAEKITKSYGLKKIAVISGIGVRDYYRNQGFRLSQTYMIKSV